MDYFSIEKIKYFGPLYYTDKQAVKTAGPSLDVYVLI